MESERPIEKLLRTIARRRRDQAGPPLEMHPATRRLLQGEVARQFKGSRTPDRRSGLLAWLRLPWVYAAGTTVLILVLAILFLPDRRESSMEIAGNWKGAVSDADLHIEQERQVAAPQSVPRQERSRLLRAEAESSASGPLDGSMAKQPLMAGEAPVESRDNLMLEGSVGRLTVNTGADLATVATAIQKTAEQRVAFAAIRTNERSILAAFELIREGDVIRLLDQDGSIYSGRFDRAPHQSSSLDAVTRTDVPPGEWFEVTGTHRSTGRRVEFTGALRTAATPARPGALAIRSQDPAAEGMAAAAEAPASERLEIRGTVKLDGTEELDLEARSRR